VTAVQKENCGKRVFLISLVLVIIGTVGFFTLRGHWAFYPLAHAGALGVLGLLGALAGLIAEKKGYDFRKAFLVGLLVPVALGVIAVFAVKIIGGEGTPFYCGGSVCLAAAIILIIIYSLVKARPHKIPNR
jgi:peptidoglycan/LPS O-acetylase OafA/YrhL